MIVNILKGILVLQCQASGSRWSASEPGVPKQ
jgi:hypothetical protein